MRQSNLYIILFATALTVVFGGALSLTYVSLKPIQDKQVELDTKKKILGAVMDISDLEDPEQIFQIYNQKVKSLVVDVDGNILDKDEKGNNYIAENINIKKNAKLPVQERSYPIFLFVDDDGKIKFYIFPTFGTGLWDWISSYIAFEKDLNTIKGIAFDHKSETPGLGARITEAAVQNRYIGKKIFNDSQLVSVEMIKGEGNTGLTEYQVDGLSGATMTAKGVNAMLKSYMECYTAFINKSKESESYLKSIR